MPRPDDQSEFLFGDGPAPELAPPEPLADLVAAMTRLWSLPLYQKARLTLKNHSLDEVSGRLELVSAPDLPSTLRTRSRCAQAASSSPATRSLLGRWCKHPPPFA